MVKDEIIEKFLQSLYDKYNVRSPILKNIFLQVLIEIPDKDFSDTEIENALIGTIEIFKEEIRDFIRGMETNELMKLLGEKMVDDVREKKTNEEGNVTGLFKVKDNE